MTRTPLKRTRLSLSDLLDREGQAGLNRLASKINCNPKYLRQLANGPKTPSPVLAWALVKADPRLSFERLFEHAMPRQDGEMPRVRRWAV